MAESLTAMRARLARLEQVREDIACGAATASVSTGGHAVTYTAANLAELRTIIAELRVKIAAAEGRNRGSGGIYHRG